MTLLDHLRTDRACQKGKKPLPETVFAAVAGIVQKFQLISAPAAGNFGGAPLEMTPPPRLSLFPLLTQAQWRLTQEIILRFDNPYIVYARSPEELTLSLQLFRQNPDIPPETLRRHSLTVLFHQVITLARQQS